MLATDCQLATLVFFSFLCLNNVIRQILFRYDLPAKVFNRKFYLRYSDVIMSPMAYEITDVLIVYSTVCSGADHRKHQSSTSLAFVRRIHQWSRNSPHKGPVTRKMFSFDDVIMNVTFLREDNVLIRMNLSMRYVMVNTTPCFLGILTTLWGIVTPYGFGDLGQHWFR